MSDFYFSEEPHAKSHPQQLTAELRGKTFLFTTDAGVFSKAGIDYGSRLLIETFTEPDISGSLLDIGCGYGPIGIALAASFPSRKMVMTDINQRAVRLADENAGRNHVAAEVVQGNLYEQIRGKYAAIVTNPPIRAGKAIVSRILSESVNYLDEGGELWVVIQKKQGAPSALKLLREIYGQVTVAARKKGYHVFHMKKR
ncbi:class I SAM-dependent methyltransferase [Sporolactobacillus vineae]|uniref:class I SAM-dependent methyltransferase n=1 Tax=Sporolactobacillus vineae TaxID=444463 RepID=UPI0002880382|nr:class I SAM-dependent methyltransferase [Sporolactobacillus vineae]